MDKTFYWWSQMVEYTVESDNGKSKKITEEYLVKAVDPTDAQIQLTKDLTEYGMHDFKIKSQKRTNITKVIVPIGTDIND